MKLKLLGALIMLLCMVGKTKADGIVKYTPTTRATTLENGKNYMIYCASLPSSQDRTGILYENGNNQVGFYCSKKPHNGFSTTNTRFLWKVTTTTDQNKFYIKNVSSQKYIGSDGRANKDNTTDLYIYPWKSEGVESAGVDVESEDGTRVANASSTDQKVFIVKNNATEYWHANVGSFTTWTSGHPFAFYEYEEENVATVDYTINFTGTGNGTVKCGEDILTNGQTYTANKLLESSDISVEGCISNVVIDDINMRVNVTLYGLPNISTASQKYYYSLKDTRGRNRYAYYKGDNEFLGTDGALNNDNRLFYFTQSAEQAALSTDEYKVVSIHNLAAEGKEMTAMKSWGTAQTNWYIKLSPQVNDANYIAVCPNSSFGSDSWNDYSTNIQGWSASDNNSAWEFVAVNTSNYTVQVNGLPSETSLAGVTVHGKNFNKGATISSAYRDALFQGMTFMDVPGYTACITGNGSNIRVAYTKEIMFSNAPVNGTWADNTTWYYIQQKGNGYISTGSNYKDNTGFKVNQTAKPTDENGLWAIVESNDGTYKFYNKQGGVIAFTNTTDDIKASLSESTDAANSNFKLEPGVQAGTWCIRINGTTNARWNNRGNYLATWTSNDSFYGGGTQSNCTGGSGNGATGSQYVFEIFEPVENLLPSSWNNYSSSEENTSWTEGNSSMTTANTANKATHKYHEWNVNLSDHSGDVEMTFQYTKGVSNGSARLDISCVEVLSADGTEILSSDVHNGYSGGLNSLNSYLISFPNKNTDYILRVWSFDTQNSFGSISFNWKDDKDKDFALATAKSLIHEGVGYPQNTSNGYSALVGINSESSHSEIEAAKKAYIEETNISLPVSGKAYKLNFLNPNGTKHYITYGSELGLSTDASQAATIVFKEVDTQNHKFIALLRDGNIVTWRGDGNEGFKNDGTTAKGFSTMVALDNTYDDWNLCSFQNQGITEAQLGTIKMISRRNQTNSCWVILTNTSAWAKANEASFFNNNAATSALQFEEVPNTTAESTGYADGAEKYSLYTTAKANNTKYGSLFGSELGQYHFGDNQTSGYMDAVKACTTLEEERNTVPVTINQPAEGSFICIRSVKAGTGYVNAEPSTSHTNCLKVGEKSNSSIYCYTGGKLIAYNNGMRLVKNSDSNGFLALGTVDAEGANIAFNGANRQNGAYTVTFDGRYLYAADNATNTDAGSSEGNNGYDFTLEQVTTLPVALGSVNNKRYATFYAPVGITGLDGVKAYTVVEEDGKAKMTAVDEIPAETAVVLYSNDNEKETANLTIGEVSSSSSNNLLSGTIATTTTESGCLTLQDGATGIGFYLYGGDSLKGFRSYIPAANAQLVKGMALDFDMETIIRGIEEAEQQGAEMYDLSGRRIQNAQKGIYIMNGKKVIK